MINSQHRYWSCGVSQQNIDPLQRSDCQPLNQRVTPPAAAAAAEDKTGSHPASLSDVPRSMMDGGCYRTIRYTATAAVYCDTLAPYCPHLATGGSASPSNDQFVPPGAERLRVPFPNSSFTRKLLKYSSTRPSSRIFLIATLYMTPQRGQNV